MFIFSKFLTPCSVHTCTFSKLSLGGISVVCRRNDSVARNFLHTVLVRIRNTAGLTPGCLTLRSQICINIGYIECHVTPLLSAHVTTFYFKMMDAIAAFFNVNVLKIKLCHINMCKKKNLSCL